MRKLFTVVLLAAVCLGANAQKWTSLFNGKDLSGWKQVTGSAKYEVQDGCIVGTCLASKINSFLATNEKYSDFILEFEFKMEEPSNSGVQFRSRVNESGRTMGYQFEFDGSKRAWTGGIYDEARRGWLYPLTFNVEAGKAYKIEAWNKGRIEAVGSHIRTFVNGVLCSDLIDDADSEGFIGLQVHNPGKAAEKIGKKVYWKNIRICTTKPEKYFVKKAAAIHQVNAVSNTLSAQQKADGWKLLWDGKTTNGWRSAKADKFPDHGWSIKNGELCVHANDGAESKNGGDIVTTEKYENFWLSVDFKITRGANSGIKYFVNHEFYKNANGSAIGCEFQILDDDVHPDAKLGVKGNRTLGSLYDLIRAEKDGAYFRKTQWNTAWVKVQGDHVEHWLNGVKILEYERNNQMFNALVAYSKFKNWENFGNHKTGNILLQDHGDEVHYKNLLIKPL